MTFQNKGQVMILKKIIGTALVLRLKRSQLSIMYGDLVWWKRME